MCCMRRGTLPRIFVLSLGPRADPRLASRRQYCGAPRHPCRLRSPAKHYSFAHSPRHVQPQPRCASEHRSGIGTGPLLPWGLDCSTAPEIRDWGPRRAKRSIRSRRCPARGPPIPIRRAYARQRAWHRTFVPVAMPPQAAMRQHRAVSLPARVRARGQVYRRRSRRIVE